jgi:uncharacterized protein
VSDGTFARRDLFKRTLAAGVGAGLVSASDPLQLAQAAQRVPTKVLGATGEEIPILLLGCSQKFDPVYDKLLHRCLKEGVTYLDTAQAYANGQSHKTLATFIDQVDDRDKLWITSKVMLVGKRATPQAYRTNVDRMLPVLGVDYLDMFFMHAVRNVDNLGPDFLKMGDDIKKDGKAKFFGFSCHDGNVVELMNKAASIGGDAINAIMFRYNFSKYGDLELNKAIDACAEAGIGLIAMKTQASVPEDGEMVKKFKSDNFNLFQAKLKAVWADERIAAAVSEMSNTAELKDNAAAAKSQIPLAMNEFQQLNQYAAQTASSRCQGCSHLCESRVDGDLRIADSLRYLMYDECYGSTSLAKQRYREMTPAERDFTGVDLRSATKVCPQGIDILARLNRAKQQLA